MNKKTLRDVPLKGKRVVMRVDFNVPIENGVMVEPDRTSGPVKPYIPPTELTDNEALPYGNVVGAPLGF